jgi:GDP-4-dehydro-6-deoxy-D-mannose reductase
LLKKLLTFYVLSFTFLYFYPYSTAEHLIYIWMKILVTGFSGFVSTHFLDLLHKVEPGSTILGVDKHPPSIDSNAYPRLNISYQNIDLLNKSIVDETLRNFQPEYILHLASVSSVAQSWQTPLESFVNNTNIFLNLVEQVRVNNIPCRILSVGSSEEYGEVEESKLPLTEEHPLKPLSPYAVARISQEMLSKIYADGYGQDIIITRSFNHIGPGQKENFVISSFAKQLVQLATGNGNDNKLVAGNLSIVRDFVDVRDVVEAYYLLLKNGIRGEVYNICSGNGIELKEIIVKMSELLNIDIRVEVNPSLIRPNENKKIIGSYQKIKNGLGWEPAIPIEKSLADIITYWQQKAN